MFFVSVQTFTESGISYKVISYGKVEVSDATSVTGDIVLPATLQHNGTDYNVTAIGDGAFAFNHALTSIQIPSGVTRIGERAFQGTEGLTMIQLPATLNELGLSAFNGSFIERIAIPTGFNKIEDGAFSYSSIKALNLPETVKSIERFAYYHAKDLTLADIPEGVTIIKDFAFTSCYNLRILIIPSTVTQIGQEAFRFCNGLEEIYIVSPTPNIILYGNSFDGVDFNKTTLYVPIGSKSAYGKADTWKNFKNIVGSNKVPTSTLDIENKLPKISKSGNSIVIEGDLNGRNITVYDIKGSILYNNNATGNNVSIPLANGNVYIVKIENIIHKVAL